MKKRIFIFLLCTLLIFSLLGCSSDKLENYKQAVQKTASIKRGKTSGEFSAVMGYTNKSIEGSWEVAFDEPQKKSIFHNYLNMGGLGFDYNLYINGEEAYIKLPMLGKYLKINSISGDDEQKKYISIDTIKEINKLWLSIMKQENVFKGKKILITTGDGEVKATHYSIELEDNQFKELTMGTVRAIAEDENIRNSFEEFKNSYHFNGEMDFDTIIKIIKGNLKACQMKSFKYDAYVDIDGYIVNEKLEFEMVFDVKELGSMTNLRYKMENKNWNINQKQEFEFPQLTEENTFQGELTEQSVPFNMKDLFNKGSKEGEDK